MTPQEEMAAREELSKLEKQLVAVQGEEPLVLPVVGGQAIASVVSGWTGIPLGKMVRDEIQAVLSLKERMAERVIGQSHALDAISQRIRTSRANLTDPKRPIGVFMFVGPSGVGKTETAMALADILFGGDRNMVIVNMSEYKESHKISATSPAPAKGLVGYGEPDALYSTSSRRKPYCVVLLDEVEKAQHRRARTLLPGVRQGDALRFLRQRHQLQEHNHHPHLERRHRHRHEAKVRADPDTKPDPEAARPGLCGSPDLLEGVQARRYWAASP